MKDNNEQGINPAEELVKMMLKEKYFYISLYSLLEINRYIDAAAYSVNSCMDDLPDVKEKINLAQKMLHEILSDIKPSNLN